MDAPIRKDRMVDLQNLMARINQHSGAALKNYRAARNRELVTMIDSGRVPVADIPTPDDEQINGLARMLHKELGKSYEELVAEFKANPPLSMFGGQDYMQHRSKVYLFAQFGKLPVSDRMFEEIRIFAWQAMVTTITWFAQEGLTTVDADLESVCSRLLEYTPERARRQPYVVDRRWKMK